MIKNIAVIGSGTMGNGIAHVFAQFGYKVSLIDVNAQALEKALATITKNIDRQIAKGSLTEADKTAALANIKTFTKIEEGVKQTDLVIEAATENVQIKLEIFKQLDAVCDANTILASNTSSISITKLAAGAKQSAVPYPVPGNSRARRPRQRTQRATKAATKAWCP